MAKKASRAPEPMENRPVRADRLHARLSLVGRSTSGVVTSPEPLWTGDDLIARQLASGLFRLGGGMVEARDQTPWTISPPSPNWENALQGFDWLDHAVAASEPADRAKLISWLFDWISLYGAGKGPGWRPDLTGRRLARWICHAPVLLNGAGSVKPKAFFRSLGRQTRFLRRRWSSAPEGLPRFQAAAGLIYAGLALEGAGGGVMKEGVRALDKTGRTNIGADGGLSSRSPEDLFEVFAILVWAAQSLRENGIEPSSGHTDALARIAPAIRAMRMGDGSLTRFHGGGGGDPERIDRALVASGIRPTMRIHECMGFHRISTARSTVVFDGGVVGKGDEAVGFHASAFCFEASVGRRLMIINCGPGAAFGDEWRTASRATAAHSGLTIEDMSSSRLITRKTGAPRLLGGAREISCTREEDATGVRLIASHDGYLATHGLIHQRRLILTADGGDFRGEDNVAAIGPGPQSAFDIAAGRMDKMAIPFIIRFHLHPDVEADVFLAGSAVRLRPPTGDLWVMRQLGGDLTIEDSVFLDDRRVRPRATKQIVVRGEAKEYSGVVKWAFRRAEPNKPAPRDLAETAAADT